MATRTLEIEEADWNYQKLVNLYNSPYNGNADIYWMNTRFFSNLREKSGVDQTIK
jgi:hypothetical protein